MAWRVGVALLAHETNTFADSSTGTTGYEGFEVWRGAELEEFWSGSKTSPIAMIESVREIGAEAIPLYGALAQPSGTIEADAYARLREELLDGLRKELPVDAVALALHGAGVAEGCDDIEADIAAAVREVVGPKIPVVGSFDLHGNVTQKMADSLDGFSAFRLYPHEDMYESGAEAIRLIHSLLEGRVQPRSHVEYIPVLLPPSTTDNYPASEVNQLCRAMEKRAGIIACMFFHGFPYADVPEAGASVVAVADGDRRRARDVAVEVAGWIWDHREDFRAKDSSPAEAVERASRAIEGPVLINETNDNCGGGAPGDATHLLTAMIDADLRESCFGTMFDPAVADQAHQAGLGATIEIKLGGKHDDIHGKPVAASALVKALTDGRFTLSAFAPGMKMDLGKSARLEIHGIDVIVVSGRSQVFDPEVFALHGIDVRTKQVVGLKSSAHFRAGFRDIAKEIITSNAPGVTSTNVEVFERRRKGVPLWPVDDDAAYVPSVG